MFRVNDTVQYFVNATNGYIQGTVLNLTGLEDYPVTVKLTNGKIKYFTLDGKLMVYHKFISLTKVTNKKSWQQDDYRKAK